MMKSAFPRLGGLAACTTILVACATFVAISPAAWSEENLLWKATNTLPATVVPTYINQPSPFPATVIAPPPVADTSAEDEALLEQKRLRDEAYNSAESIIKRGTALQPQVTSLRVGGMLDGTLGARVLLNNQWVGKGSKVLVRQTKSSAALEAIKSLKSYDEDAASELTGTLNDELARHATAELSVQSITSRTLILVGAGGASYPIDFSVDNR